MAALIAGLLAFAWTSGGQLWIYAPLAIGLTLFALPHGALDHLVVKERLRELGVDAPWTVIIVTYLLLAVAFGALWLLSPAIGLIAFLGMTVYHWGKGDQWIHQRIGGALERNGFAMVLAFGGIPIGFPFLFQPTATRSVIADCLGLFGAASISVDLTMASGVLIGLAAVCVVLIACAGALTRSPRMQLFSRRRLPEALVLATVFAALHPLLSIGLYFCFWHGLRHLARLIHTPPFAARLGSKSLSHGLLVLSWKALPLTLATLIFLGGLAAAQPAESLSAGRLVGLYLVVLSMVTFPHAIVVEMIDGWKPARLATFARPALSNTKTTEITEESWTFQT